MAKPNYSYEKRQRDLARKKKKDEKEQRKQARRQSPAAESGEPEPAEKDSGPEA